MLTFLLGVILGYWVRPRGPRIAAWVLDKF